MDETTAEQEQFGRSQLLLVTGGSRGIGAAIARQAVAAGFRVAINYAASHESAVALVDSIRDSGGEAQAFCADVSNDAAVRRMFAELDAKMGRIDALVNNAGIIGASCAFEALDPGVLARVFAVNALSQFYCSREAVLRMSTKHGGIGGAIVNVSSRAVAMGGLPGEIHYAASKGAVEAMSKGMARELGPLGIRVNVVRPGPITTDIHEVHGGLERIRKIGSEGPLGRAGKPVEVAAAALWLVSPAASYVTGCILEVTGGL